MTETVALYSAYEYEYKLDRLSLVRVDFSFLVLKFLQIKINKESTILSLVRVDF